MCTTYTWLAYPWPERGQRGQRGSATSRPAPRVMPPRAVPPCIHEEDEEAVRGRTPRHRRRRARHWVGLAIVGVQMAAWCLVGALLMHRGVVNLKRRDASTATPTASPHSLEAPSSTTSTTAVPSRLEDDLAAMTEGPDAEADAEADVPMVDSAPRRGWSAFLPMRPPPGLVAPRDDVIFDAPPSPGGGVKAESTGAATAVVMVTVGGVMLVVGPTFMMIKIMDVYQRQRRLAKQRARREDPPPSYDEVAEKAPRYSALFRVLENGELTAVCLEEAASDASAASRAPPTSPSGAASTAGTAGTAPRGTEEASAINSGAATGCGESQPHASAPLRPDEDDDQEAEPDASTPLRPQELPKKPDACNDELSRRRSV